MKISAFAWAAALTAAALAFPTFAEPGDGTGNGAIVSSPEASVWGDGNAAKAQDVLKRGDAVAGMTANFPNPAAWEFESVGDRLRVVYFRGAPPGNYKTGWMDAKDVVRFTFAVPCERSDSPFAFAQGGKQIWNACFEKARDEKLKALRPEWEKEKTAKPAAR
jgi:hypothetical protein